MKKTAIYPGCSLEGTANSYLASVEKVLKCLDISCAELDDWNCCGATSAHAVDHTLYLGLAAKNLELAEKQGYEEVLAPCAACYHRLASANADFARVDGLRERINKEAELNYGGTIKVRNVLDLLVNVVGTTRIAEKVRSPLSDLKVACYYGCLNTRIPHFKSFDNAAYPMSMDHIVEALGGKALDWGYKTDCCGASLFVTAEQTVHRLVSRIIKDAEARGADCICVACPMCHNNLDTKQDEFRAESGIERPIPVLFVSQLMGLAFGLDPAELRLADLFVSAKDLVST